MVSYCDIFIGLPLRLIFGFSSDRLKVFKCICMYARTYNVSMHASRRLEMHVFACVCVYASRCLTLLQAPDPHTLTFLRETFSTRFKTGGTDSELLCVRVLARTKTPWLLFTLARAP